MTNPEELNADEQNTGKATEKNGESTLDAEEELKIKAINHLIDTLRFTHREQLIGDPKQVHELYEQAKREVSGQQEEQLDEDWQEPDDER